ncbi:MAG: LamG-like jellyroll fold domain-containing protein, partial [Marinoscillum sp.]
MTLYNTVPCLRTASRLFIVLNLLLLNWQGFGQDYSLVFDGDDTDITTPDLVQVNGFTALTSMTIEVWVKVDALKAGYMGIMDFQDDPYFGFSGNDLIIYMSGSAIVARQDFTPYIGTWTHVAVSITNGDQRLFINGSQVAYAQNGGGTVGPGTAAFDGHAGNFGIAKNADNSDASFDGYMDELRIWNTTRDASTINSQKDTELIGNESGLISYYNFNEGTGTILSDQTTNSHDGNLLNGNNTSPADGSLYGPVWSTDVPLTPAGNSALTFDGSGDYVDLFEDDLFTGDFTVEAWVYLTDFASAYRPIISKANTTNSNAEFNLQVQQSTGNVNFFLGNGSGISNVYGNDNGSDQDITLNAWTHIAAVVDGINMYLYIDGQLSGSSTFSGVRQNNSNVVQIGRYYNGVTQFWPGQIDEVRIWNEARSAGDIGENHDRAMTGGESGLVAYYDFSDGTGTTLNDIAGTNQSGTINGSAVWNTTGPTLDDPPADVVRPTPTISSSTSEITGLDPFEITITFDEPVIGFLVEDISVINGSADNLQGDGQTFTADITPSSALDLTVDINENVATDVASNLNVASNQLAVSFTINTVSIVGLAGGPTYMTFESNLGAWEAVVEAFNTNTFSYRINDDPALDFGDGENPDPEFDGTPDLGGLPVYINADGLYVINFGGAAEWYGATLINSLGILGDALPVDWDSDIDLIDQGGGVFSLNNLKFTTGQWKVRANDLWDRSWGDDGADGSLDQTGANIAVSVGTYDVTIDLINRTYSLVTPPNYALYFDGTDDYVSGTGINLANSDFTIETWINSGNPSNNNQTIFGLGSNGTDDQALHIRLQSSSVLIGFVFNDITIPYTVTTGWHHLAVTHNTTTLVSSLYIDGSFIGSGTHDNPFIGNTDFKIGNNAWDSSSPFIGEIDEVRVWNTARSEAQIASLKDEQLTGSDPGLIAYYDFSDETGITLTDRAGSNDGTLTNFA